MIKLNDKSSTLEIFTALRNAIETGLDIELVTTCTDTFVSIKSKRRIDFSDSQDLSACANVIKKSLIDFAGFDKDFTISEKIISAIHLANRFKEKKIYSISKPEVFVCKQNDNVIFLRSDEDLTEISPTDWGNALKHLKSGKPVTNANWNGSGLTVHLQIPDEHSKMTLPYFYLEYPADHKTTPNARVPWVPSVTDNLSESWIPL